ncbi:DNA translocase FtsK [Acinetobacter rathckeae]|uniref:DNA translocase FtsK n=1 Tax=Acinetobacter rathckeae TaxID=2605272 RepID=UPI0018A2E8E7|nr:DNA translocase FtsK [Acinetobacter rathckeae]MBF7688534.1 DNA translocase FtsK 4TM domain-containing protein [Acinetobacter rathckeae]MBF7695781.1 DNA translocase FtsK 4TM domain-containing protein [Acinetobacter rathckeae]
MTAVSSVYAQRFITTLFLVSFGIYLFLATVTYTPFDPGWMHISSDTQQVSNASGVAGAWIADLLFGFLGWASLLIPLFFFIEAIQLWWPHSFLSRPFRYAAQFFILLATSSLLYLFWHIPNDALDNASGGIIGYEIGANLVQLLTIYGAGVFLIVLWSMLFTLAFGIQWHKTWATLKATPSYLQELFYRNVPDSEADYDLTLKTVKKKRSEPKVDTEEKQETSSEHVENIPNTVSTVEVNDPTAEKLFANLVKQEQLQSNKATSKTERIEPVLTAMPASEKVVESGEIWRALDPQQDEQHQQDIDALLKLAEDQKEAVTHEQTAETKKPALDWNDEKIFNELLEAVPQHQQETTITYAESTPEHQQTHINTPLSLEVKTDDQHLQDIEKLLATDTVVPTQSVEQQSITKTMTSYAQSSAFVQANINTDLNQPLSKQEFVEAWQETAGVPETEEDDLDAPLTDAYGRPMSRAMQVVKKRSGLSPIPEKTLLDKVDPNKKINFTEEQLARLSELLEIKLQEFNVKAKVVEAQPGPVVTRFELDLAPGVKASKVTNISRDLARSMSMASVRVVEVIPGKPYIGIEVPNSSREMVRLTELLDTEDYLNPNNLISVAMGKDISGRPVLADLAKAPHMLVAGTTGSGKSVAVNAMILSMLLKYTPNDLRLILIDPKQLELANYSDIPHLLTPVVTDMKDAVSALNWCVNEMERRYKLMSFLKVRKIVDYNRKVKEAIMSGEDLIDPTWKPSDSATQERAPRLQTLPMIVIVADEFADMIMQVGKKAEEMITRLAQKSRAAGIHLLLATQRPSVDVITGLIKANIPTRVALRVNSKIDSRTILDAGGAEDLLGHGDMLFLGPGKIEPERVHGAFISDDEVNRICDAWRERGDPDYVDEILTPYDEEPTSRGSGGEDGESNPDTDVLYDQAVAFVLETRKATASSIQRKFSLGYNRAARLIDSMEENGIVSAMGANGKRDILV